MLAYFRTLFEYNCWANRKILDAAAQVEEAQYFAAVDGLSFGSLHATLVHILVAELVWLARWQGTLPPDALKDARIADQLAVTEIPTFAELKRMYADVEAKQETFFAALTEEAIDRPLSYRTQYGEPNVQPLSETLGHLFNHSTQFRAEAAVRLSQLGQSPGDIDLIIFLRRR